MEKGDLKVEASEEAILLKPGRKSSTKSPRQAFSLAEIKDPVFWRDVLAEILISYFLLSFITFSLTTLNTEIYKVSTTHVGLMVGFVVFLLISAYGPISGGHMNPAVTFAFLLSGRITVCRAGFYTAAQCVGGTLGSVVVKALSPESMLEERPFKAFLPGPDLGPIKAGVVEAIFTFNLCFVALMVSDNRVQKLQLPALPTGFCVGTAILATGTWTGACLNPIVSLGPAVAAKDFTYIWVYWAGPYAGGIIAAILFRFFYYVKKRFGAKGTTSSGAEDEDIRKLVAKLLQRLEQVSDKENANTLAGTSTDEKCPRIAEI